MQIILFFISYLISIVGNFADWYHSRDFDMFGLTEGNKLMRDENGFFASKKNAIGSIVFVHLQFLGFLDPQYLAFAGIPFVVVGLFRLYHGLRNARNKKENRIEQIRWLKSFAAGNPETVTLLQYKGKRRFSALFGFFYSDKPDEVSALEEITRKLSALARLPESKWFERAEIARIQAMGF